MRAMYKQGETVLQGKIEDVFYIESIKSYQYKISAEWYHEKAVMPKLRKHEYYKSLICKSVLTKKEKLSLIFSEAVLMGYYNHDMKIVNVFFEGIAEGGKIPKDVWMLKNIQNIIHE